jgi:hypothetical protein
MEDIFTAEDIKNYQGLLNTKATDTIEGYELFYEGQGFKSWRKLKGVCVCLSDEFSGVDSQSQDTGLYMYRSIGVVPCKPEVYFKFYRDINNWKTWDTNCERMCSIRV